MESENDSLDYAQDIEKLLEKIKIQKKILLKRVDFRKLLEMVCKIILQFYEIVWIRNTV